MPQPSTAMLTPPASTAATCAAVSIPRAKPETTATPAPARSPAKVTVNALANGLHLRVPTTPMARGVGLCKPSSADNRPRTHSSGGGSKIARSASGYATCEKPIICAPTLPARSSSVSPRAKADSRAGLEVKLDRLEASNADTPRSSVRLAANTRSAVPNASNSALTRTGPRLGMKNSARLERNSRSAGAAVLVIQNPPCDTRIHSFVFERPRADRRKDQREAQQHGRVRQHRHHPSAAQDHVL